MGWCAWRPAALLRVVMFTRCGFDCRFIKQPHTNIVSRFLLTAASCAPSGQVSWRLSQSLPVPCACHPSHFPAHPFSPLQPPSPPRSPRGHRSARQAWLSRPQHSHLRRRLSWDSLGLADRSEPRLGVRVPGHITHGLGSRRASGGLGMAVAWAAAALLCLSSSRSLSLCVRGPVTVPSVSRRRGFASWTRVLISALEQGHWSEHRGPVAWTQPESCHCPANTRCLYCQSCHEGHCPFMLTECPACKGLVRLGEKEHHLEHQCPERSLSCRHCRAPCCPAGMKVSVPRQHAGPRLPPSASWRLDGPGPEPADAPRTPGRG